MIAFVLLLTLTAHDVQDEQAEVQEKLEAERALFESLQSDKQELLSVLDTTEKLFRASAERVTRLEKQTAFLKASTEAISKELAAADEELKAREAAIAPHLRTLQRLSHQDRLSQFLSAKDFGALVKTERGLSRVVDADLRELEDIARVARYQHLQSARLSRLSETAKVLKEGLEVEQQLAKARRVRFSELLAQTGAEANKVSRVVRELEAQEKQLEQFVGDLKSAGEFGFRSRKGHLPMPVPGGLIEVGFGKVVNPRFNTVTVQKGVDVRARLGSPVVTVGEGTVAFSGWLKGYGNLVIVDHGGNYHSLYAHLAQSLVEPGNEVQEGEEIARVGDTGSLKGAYLYFEIRKAGQAVDPTPWFDPEEIK